MVGTIVTLNSRLRDFCIIAKVRTIRSRPFIARNSVCTGIRIRSLAANALTIITPKIGGQSIST
ncbi:Uncharacterised protein [Vibrio cholerae]|nr:Uncharacterised protein [Vibrio cholerae]CSD24195.1 Uncharacterised protein [Vibrio cholerae]